MIFVCRYVSAVALPVWSFYYNTDIWLDNTALSHPQRLFDKVSDAYLSGHRDSARKGSHDGFCNQRWDNSRRVSSFEGSAEKLREHWDYYTLLGPGCSACIWTSSGHWFPCRYNHVLRAKYLFWNAKVVVGRISTTVRIDWEAQQTWTLNGRDINAIFLSAHRKEKKLELLSVLTSTFSDSDY